MLPEHDVVIVDEAHELVDRVTGVATGELTRGAWSRRPRAAAASWSTRPIADRLVEAGEGLGAGARGPAARPLGGAPPARVAGRCRRSATRPRRASTALGGERREEPEAAAGRKIAQAALDEVARHRRSGCSRRSTSRTRRSAATSCGWPRWAPTRAQGAARRPAGGRRAAARAAVRALAPWSSPRPRWPSAATSTRWPGSGGSRRPRPREAATTTRCPIPRPRSGRGWTSARRSRTPRAASSTSPSRCPRPGATGCRPPTSTRSPGSSRRRAGARSGCSRRCAPPSRPPRRCATGWPHRCSARATTPRCCWSSGSPRTRRRRCSARCRSGRASTCPGRRCRA